MRFIVGQKYAFVQVTFERDKGAFITSPKYIPWRDTLKTIQVKILTCESHHKVPSQSTDESVHDGFIFSSDSHRYYNQYPRASYGPSNLNDSEDYMVTQRLELPENYDFVNKSMRDYRWELASNYLSRLLLGIKQSPLHSSGGAFQPHFDEVARVLKDNNVEVEIKPIWADHPDIKTVETHIN